MPRERVFAGVLLLGLAGELTGLVHASRVTGEIIDAVNQKASTADAQAAELREKAAGLEKEAASLRKDAENERLARVQLQTAIVPRRLSAEDRKEITEASRKFLRPGVKILVRSTNGDEAGLAIQVAGALRDAGFDVDRQIYSGVFYELGYLCSRENIDIAQELIGIVGDKARMPITGMNYTLPTGSPVTLVIGLRHQGQLPKITHSPSS